MKTYRNKQVMQAVQWFPGVEVEGVKIETPHYGNEDIGLVNNGPHAIHRGEWLGKTGKIVRVFSDEYFREHYELVEGGE